MRIPAWIIGRGLGPKAMEAALTSFTLSLRLEMFLERLGSLAIGDKYKTLYITYIYIYTYYSIHHTIY